MMPSGLDKLPHFQEKVNSEQFPYSEQLIDLRIENGLDVYQMTARTMLLDVDTYIKMESVDTTISLDDYKQAIRNFHKTTAYIKSDSFKKKPKGIILSDYFDIDEITFKDLDIFKEVLNHTNNINNDNIGNSGSYDDKE